MENDITQINFVVGTVEAENEVLVSFRGFESPEETQAYADWLNDNNYRTVRGKRFRNEHTHSIIKKKRLSDERFSNIE